MEATHVAERSGYALAETPELVGWILSFGAGVRVIRPESLRSLVHAAAAEG